MTEEQRKSLIDKILLITEGIDKTESDSGIGWWETSEGAAFGARTLSFIIRAICEVDEKPLIELDNGKREG